MNPQLVPPGFLLAFRAAHGELPPMTSAEVAEFRSSIARKAAEDDRKRDPGAQLELAA